MRVVSFNLWFSEKGRWERAESLLIALITMSPPPEVICLQEVVPEIGSHLRNLLHSKYPYVSSQDIERYGIMTLSVYPITQSFIFPLDTTMGRELLVTEIKYQNLEVDKDKLVENNATFLVANIHFESEFNSNGINKVKWDQYARVEKLLDSLYLEHRPMILCSDTNLSSRDESHFFQSHEWVDCWMATGSANEHRITFDGKTNEHLLDKQRRVYRSRLDRILVRGDVDILQFQLVKGIEGLVMPSDHYGVVTDLEMRSK